MEKRVVLFIILTFLVFIGFQYLIPKRMRPVAVQEVGTQTGGQAVPSQKSIIQPKAETAPTPVGTSPQDTQAAAQKIVIAGDLYRAVIDNQGAVLTSWELNKYKSAQNRVFEMVAGYRNGEKRSYPGSMVFGDAALSTLVNEEFYQVSIEGRENGGQPLAPPVTVVLRLNRGDLNIEKRYRFEKDNYVADLSIRATKAGNPLVGRFFLGQDIGPEQEHLSSSAKLEAIYWSDGKVRRESPPKDPQELKKIEGDVRWIGLDMQYFSLIAIPRQPLAYFNIQKHAINAVGLDGKQVSRDLLKVTAPLSGSAEYQLYVGPKNQQNLKGVKSADIGGVINYGMFSVIVYPLLSSLRWIYQYVQNYGYAIILLTMILSLLLFPFRLKQMVSMKRMSVVQPKVKAIQEKYRRYKATDPKRAEMNQEIMALYKEHNVNPLGGCLPLLLQMPLLFAFYALLAYSIELRQAPFIWWIHDLSAKDPIYVLPIVMGLTSFISQKMTPMTPGADPTQAKMMMLMPLIFTFMFLNLSSGLNLYFLCSNIFQVAFQKVAERWMKDGKAVSPSKS